MRTSWLLASYLVGLLSLNLSASARADCTQEQAFNRMMALNQVGAKLQAALPDPREDPAGYEANYQRVIDFSTRLASAGPLLAAQKYNEACAVYQKLESDFKVDTGKSNTLTLSELKKDGGKGRGGTCDLSEAAIRMAQITDKYVEARKHNKLSPLQAKEFDRQSREIGITMNEDPSKACTQMADLEKLFP